MRPDTQQTFLAIGDVAIELRKTDAGKGDAEKKKIPCKLRPWPVDRLIEGQHYVLHLHVQ